MAPRCAAAANGSRQTSRAKQQKLPPRADATAQKSSITLAAAHDNDRRQNGCGGCGSSGGDGGTDGGGEDSVTDGVGSPAAADASRTLPLTRSV